jgi:hypothetical protein
MAANGSDSSGNHQNRGVVSLDGVLAGLETTPAIVDILDQGPLHAAIHVATAWLLAGGRLTQTTEATAFSGRQDP